VPLVDPLPISFGDAVSVLIPLGAFRDDDLGTELAYTVTVLLPSGATVPLADLPWLTLDASSRVLSGVASARGTFTFNVTASDPTGEAVWDDFVLAVNSPPVVVSAHVLMCPCVCVCGGLGCLCVQLTRRGSVRRVPATAKVLGNTPHAPSGAAHHAWRTESGAKAWHVLWASVVWLAAVVLVFGRGVGGGGGKRPRCAGSVLRRARQTRRPSFGP
jgi:hypothetical protein